MNASNKPPVDAQERWDIVRDSLQKAVDEWPDLIAEMAEKGETERTAKIITSIAQSDLPRDQVLIIGLWEAYSICDMDSEIPDLVTSRLGVHIATIFAAQQMHSKRAVV